MTNIREFEYCNCGNTEKYVFKVKNNNQIEQIYNSCDVCGFYSSLTIKNKMNEYPADFRPIYDEQITDSSFVLKVFTKIGEYEVAFLNESNVEEIVEKLEKDNRILFFSITYKNKKGVYLTQIFKHGKFN
jgi:hypothetical protein